MNWTASYVEGKKFDDAKLRVDLLPGSLVFGVSEVLTFGAKKYGDRNWEAGIRWGRVFAAAMRHLWAWWRGEDKDAETGLSHLKHAACCIAFLIEYEDTRREFDDRPTRAISPAISTTGASDYTQILADRSPTSAAVSLCGVEPHTR